MIKIIQINKDKEYSSIDSFTKFFKEDNDVQSFLNKKDFISFNQYRFFSDNKWSFNRDWNKDLDLSHMLKRFEKYSTNPRYVAENNEEIEKYVFSLNSDNLSDINLEDYKFLKNKDYLIISVKY